MGTIAVMVISFTIGVAADHYLEAKSRAATKKLIADAEKRIIDEIHKKSSGT